MIDVQFAMKTLAARRPIFHSEADLQHEFAWQLRAMLPQVSVRLEHPIGGALRGAIDLVVRGDNWKQAFELKYLCKQFQTMVDDERFALRQQSAQDTRRYDVCKDIGRMEGFSQQTGFPSTVLVLTNDPSFWRERSGSANDAAYCIADGRTLHGSLAWSVRAGAGSIKGREHPIRLTGQYPLRWQDYSEFPGPSGLFRFLAIDVRARAGSVT